MMISFLSAAAALALGPGPDDRSPFAAQPAHCPSTPQASLRETHRRARTAHIEGKAEILAADSADTLLSVQRGEITTSTRAEVLARFTGYFDRVEYRRWDDLEEPRISLSKDGTMAWMAVRIALELRRKNAAAEAPWQTFHSSWIATYRRDGCFWRMTAIASEVVPQDN